MSSIAPPHFNMVGFHAVRLVLGVLLLTAAGLKAHAETRIVESFRYFDGVFAERGPYLLGERFSAVDLFFYMLGFWTRRMPRPAFSFPHVKRQLALVHARPAVAKMMRDEGITFDLAA